MRRRRGWRALALPAGCSCASLQAADLLVKSRSCKTIVAPAAWPPAWLAGPSHPCRLPSGGGRHGAGRLVRHRCRLLWRHGLHTTRPVQRSVTQHSTAQHSAAQRSMHGPDACAATRNAGCTLSEPQCCLLLAPFLRCPAGVAWVQASYLADDGSVGRSPQFPVAAGAGSSGGGAGLQALPSECALAVLSTGGSLGRSGLLLACPTSLEARTQAWD